MHPISGEVQTREEWIEDMPFWCKDWECSLDENSEPWDKGDCKTGLLGFDSLIEIEKDANGEWVWPSCYN